MKSEDVHALTVAEIGRLTVEFDQQRRLAITELAGLANEPEISGPEAIRAETARVRALELMNGYSPPGMKMPPGAPRRPLARRPHGSVVDLLLSDPVAARAARNRWSGRVVLRAVAIFNATADAPSASASEHGAFLHHWRLDRGPHGDVHHHSA